MSALRDQDPDYGPSVADNERHRRIYEENARSTTARKITSIVEKEFSQEISTKEKEILEIQEKLQGALKTLHLLRYVIIADFYSRKQCQSPSQGGESKQTQIHPAIKRLIGKSPKSQSNINGASSRSSSPSCSDSSLASACSLEAERAGNSVNDRKRCMELEELCTVPRKIPRYVPPRSGIPELPSPSRGVRHKVRRRIIVGNISKWIPPDWREDAASHKWTMYVRGDKESPEIDEFVSKVRFFLHPSYRPNDVVEVTSAPFCLSRRGWGEFPLRVQLHFKSGLNKPMDIIHHLKLDRTYTGLQTLGAETLVDIWIYAEDRNRKIHELKQETKDRSKEIEGKEAPPEDRVDGEEVQREIETKTEPLEASVKIEEPDESDVRKEVEIKKEEEQEEEEEEELEEQGIVKDLKIKVEKEEMNVETIEKTRFNVNLDHDYLAHEVSGPRSDRVSSFLHPGLKVRSSVSPSSLRPLKISIPPAFESTQSKRVLVIQNDRTIPVDISTRSKSGRGGGVSLLKRRAGESEVVSSLKLKASSSLLLSVNYDVPALKIAETRLSCCPESGKEEQKARVALAKDKHRLQSRRDTYEEAFRSIDSLKVNEARSLVRFVVRRLPIVTKDATDPEYRRLHPYACSTEEEFFSCSMAKRRAIEWSRAKLARNLLASKPDVQGIWSTKEIVIWSRLHGFTPLCSPPLLKSLENSASKNLPDSSALLTCTEPLTFQSWLAACPDRESSRCIVAADEEEVDVTEVESPKDSKENETLEADENNSRFSVLEVDNGSLPLHEFVCETARQIGVKLALEEIVPNVLHSAAARVIGKAVECLVDEIVRMSLAKAWERSDDSCPKVIALEDVRRAILNREEFDVFTNDGLGSKLRTAALD